MEGFLQKTEIAGQQGLSPPQGSHLISCCPKGHGTEIIDTAWLKIANFDNLCPIHGGMTPESWLIPKSTVSNSLQFFREEAEIVITKFDPNLGHFSQQSGISADKRLWSRFRISLIRQ
ncbi:hypothetical protein DITRI_Ditri09bG0092800 [Diplodiscus trichospermus]